MESLGNKLKAAREGKGYTFEYVSRETNISARFLQALEAEDFSPFPSEPYIRGFLKNYGDYLGLNGEELVSLYRSLKIQEQDMPVKALLKPSPRGMKTVGAVIAGVVILGLAGLAVYLYSRIPQDGTGTAVVRTPGEYTMTTETLERRLYQGDALLVPLGDELYKLELTSLGEAVTVTTPQGTLRLDLGQEATVDLDGDGNTELKVVASDFAKHDPTPGALMLFELAGAALPGSDAAVAGATALAPGTGTAAAAVLFTSTSAYPFTLEASFQGYCLFRWEILSESDRAGQNEQYFQRAEELNIQAQNGIRLGVSDAHSIKAQVVAGGKTYPLELGGAGEVVVADLRWIRDAENRYSLALTRLE